MAHASPFLPGIPASARKRTRTSDGTSPFDAGAALTSCPQASQIKIRRVALRDKRNCPAGVRLFKGFSYFQLRVKQAPCLCSKGID